MVFCFYADASASILIEYLHKPGSDVFRKWANVFEILHGCTLDLPRALVFAALRSTSLLEEGELKPVDVLINEVQIVGVVDALDEIIFVFLQ